MSQSELSRLVKVKALTEDDFVVQASAAECEALAKRFAVSEIHELNALITLTPQKSEIVATGTLSARWSQPCAVSGDDFETSSNETIHLRFVPPYDETPGEELEISSEDCDEIPYEGDSFDLGEAVAQSFGLLIDPYATGPNADRIRKEKGIEIEGEQSGAMAEMLAALTKE